MLGPSAMPEPSWHLRVLQVAAALTLSLTSGGCARYLAGNEPREPDATVPAVFDPASKASETTSIAQQQWDEFFSDPHLQALIEEALANNQELNIRLQEIIIARNEVAARRGDYLPKVDARVGVGIEKVGRHTSQGVSDETHGVPEHLPQFGFGLAASWEVDVWGKLRAARKAADTRYLASVEARNFIVTQIIAELADSYYELLALDKQTKILEQYIGIQQDALRVVELEKQAARGTELPVRRFRAEVLENESRLADLERRRVQAENRINFLVGRFPRPVERDEASFDAPLSQSLASGVPSDLLENRPDVRRAELELQATKLDVEVAKARFYPSLSLDAGVGYQAFNARHLIDTPQSLVYNLAGNLIAPLLNRAAIKADYRAANAMQIQAVYEYERTILHAFTEVVNHLAALRALEIQTEKLAEQVDTMRAAIEVSNLLYRSAHADYMEVLLTRRDSLDAELELIEAKANQRKAAIGVYQALGGGWQRSVESDEGGEGGEG